jgi:hypothetical protein
LPPIVSVSSPVSVVEAVSDDEAVSSVAPLDVAPPVLASPLVLVLDVVPLPLEAVLSPLALVLDSDSPAEPPLPLSDATVPLSPRQPVAAARRVQSKAGPGPIALGSARVRTLLLPR